MHVQHDCAYILQDYSNELFKQVELESISKDSSDTAIWVARLVWPVSVLPGLAHPMKMLWKWLPRRGEARNQARLTHATSTASTKNIVLYFLE